MRHCRELPADVPNFPVQIQPGPNRADRRGRAGPVWRQFVMAAALVVSVFAAPGVAAALSKPAVPAATARWSQVSDTAFLNLTQDNGLPSEIAMVVAEDGTGFLWVGTLGGLARWDGYRFHQYHPDPRQPGSLPDNVIQALHCDTTGTLWVGTNSAGLVRYDPVNDRFVAYPVGPNGLSHVNVRAIENDGSGGLWIATDGGLDHLDRVSDRITHATAGGAGWAGLSGLQTYVVRRDSRGGLWVGTSAGLFHRPAASERFEAVHLPVSASTQTIPTAVIEDSAGRIWVGTQQHGAFVLDTRGEGQAWPVREVAPPGGVDMLRDQPIVSMIETQPGEVWLATMTQGIVAVNLDHGETRRIRNVPAWSVSLVDNGLRHLYKDRSGLIWVSTNRGLSRFDPRQQAILTRFGNPSPNEKLSLRVGMQVSWIQPMPGGRIWLGTHQGGIDILDASGIQVGEVEADSSRPASALPQDIVLGMTRADDGNVYVATKRGLYRVSADGVHVERVVMAGRDPAASVWAVLADGDWLWVGGQSDGLWKIDLRTGAAVSLLQETGRRLSDDRVVVLSRSGNGTLWVGTRNGLNRYNVVTGAVDQFLPDIESPRGLSAGFVTSVYEDRNHRLWVATYGGGIDVLPLVATQLPVERIGPPRGLPDNTVNALLEDRQGRVWASTDSGLALIDPARLTVRALRRADGVVFPTYWSGSAARTQEGELLFGGAGGITIVRPERLQPWDYRPPIVVTDSQIGGKSIPPGRLMPEGQASQPLIVPADANSLAVEFSAMDFSAPERNRYAYKLEGYDADWVKADPSRRLAAYTNLPPGKYRLLLRGSNREGVWSERALEIPIRVQPAWHQMWWLRAIALAGIALLVVGIVQARTRLLRARQAELERKVRERTAELEALHKALKEKSAVLERTAITDPLTGLHNRRFLTEHIDTDIAASLRRAQEARASGATPVDTDSVFLLIDIDHFKRVNDLYGHAVGDAVLVQFTRRLRQVMRESDHLVRWGGEEFLAVARDTDRDRAEELAERIRTVVADTPFEAGEGVVLPVTCSIGFACLPWLPSRPQVLDWQEVVRLADLALLAAKRAGRNAWVGLHANDVQGVDWLRADEADGLLRAMRAGHLRTTSNLPSDAVAKSMHPGGDNTAPWPFNPVSTAG